MAKETENTLLYNVAQLMKASVGMSFEANIHEETVQLDNDIKLVGSLDGHVRMQRTNQGLLVTGEVALTLELLCNRCLQIIEYPLRIPFIEQFHPTIDVVSGIVLPSIKEEDVFPIDNHHLVNLTEAIRQRIVLAIPMVVLCREACAGLCAQCGYDLNVGPCGCKQETDMRWSVLEHLLQE